MHRYRMEIPGFIISIHKNDLRLHLISNKIWAHSVMWLQKIKPNPKPQIYCTFLEFFSEFYITIGTPTVEKGFSSSRWTKRMIGILKKKVLRRETEYIGNVYLWEKITEGRSDTFFKYLKNVTHHSTTIINTKANCY